MTTVPVNREKGVLGQRNKDLGAMWTSLPDDHARVFKPHIFYTLSGLPKPQSEDDSDDDPEPDEVLQPEELVKLQELYDEIVCKDKVAKVYAKVAAGMPQGTSLPEFNRKSLKCVDRLHKQSNRMEFGYYLIASGTHAATNGQASEPGWCREYTSHPDMANYLHTKANFSTIFATHTQGLSVNEAVAKQIGHQPTSKPAKQASPGDLLKGNLARKLRSEIDNLLKIESRGFPRGPDPVNLLPSKYPKLELIQLPGSTLTSEKLKIGFDKMTSSTRQLWLNDFLNGKFKIKIKSVPGADEIEAVGGSNIDDDNRESGLAQGNNGLDVGNNNQSPNVGNELNDKYSHEEEEEEEWGGIDLSSFVPL
ncbi:uncharacterized protein MELLADRAFT_86878 [Melampsora larici-populina 98AG31]|uniref:Uncharacterized protein n=1 Tax=Melampsora larici-populina (strain 98AG31 / pathotype 3-4-7) TaxID=747676 RepID=F4R3Q1_MELLP|nr:uncharacterized protein MELLADRAFT_86878 [Melampsora larici-populina 98AG31]EGG12668.1 hypothetical protein MELLADRAFT_86878 [Melampsora larici-populina 98AG31]